MNVDVRTTKTAAEQALQQAYAAQRDALPGGAAMAEVRDSAMRQFEAQGLPSWRREEWKYTDWRALMKEALPPASAQRVVADVVSSDLPADFDARRLVFVDGVFAPDQSDLRALENGLRIRSLADALGSDAALVGRLSQARPAIDDPMVSPDAIASAADDPLVALNTALARDGIVIDVAAGATIVRPIHLVFISGDAPVSSFCRSLMTIGEDARVMVIESHIGGATHQTNNVCDIAVSDRAHVDYVRLCSQGRDVIHVSSMIATVGARARFNAFSFTTGGAVVRQQSFVRFDGKGIVASLGGATLLNGRQHVDHALVLEHVAPGCQSREIFKAVLDDECRSVFQGKIVVRPQAQKTDARMMTRALLLSDRAEADHKPELEIFADDVQCGHGATSGSLDESLKFYLMARGIPKVEAEALLVQSFLGEAVESIEHAGLRDVLMDRVAAWLQARGA